MFFFFGVCLFIRSEFVGFGGIEDRKRREGKGGIGNGFRDLDGDVGDGGRGFVGGGIDWLRLARALLVGGEGGKGRASGKMKGGSLNESKSFMNELNQGIEARLDVCMHRKRQTRIMRLGW